MTQSTNCAMKSATATSGLPQATHRARLGWNPDTLVYAKLRQAEGKNPREIRRILERYIGHQIFRELTTIHNGTSEG